MLLPNLCLLHSSYLLHGSLRNLLSCPMSHQAEEAAAALAAEEAEAAEQARLARLREEYIAAIPDEVRDQVSAAVTREVERLKKAMVRG